MVYFALTIIRQATYTWADKIGGTGIQDYHHPFVKKIVELDKEVGGTYDEALLTTVTTDIDENDVDQYGTVKKTKVTTTEESSANGLKAGRIYTEKIEHTDIQNLETYWCVGKPNKTQWINDYTLGIHGASITRTVDRSWNTGSYCRQNSQTTEATTNQEMIQSYGYDGFGNVTTDTRDGKDKDGLDLTDRITTVSWGTKGQFPNTITNAEGEQTTINWSYVIGKPNAITDPNGLIVTNDYDAFGRLTKVERKRLSNGVLT